MRPSRILVPCAVLLAAAAIAATAARAPAVRSLPVAASVAVPVAAVPVPPGATSAPRTMATKSTPAPRRASEATARQSAPVAPVTVAGIAPAGMIVGIDPETGELGLPTAEQMRELSATGTGAGLATDRFEIVDGPGAAVGIRVGTQFHEYAFAQITPDGKVLRGCFIPGPHTHDAGTPLPAPRYEER